MCVQKHIPNLEKKINEKAKDALSIENMQCCITNFSFKIEYLNITPAALIFKAAVS